MTKIYCLWGSCGIFETTCPHEDYIVTGKPACIMTLEEAKKTYPDYTFCEDWKPEKGILEDDKVFKV